LAVILFISFFLFPPGDDLQAGIRLFKERAVKVNGLRSDPGNIDKAIKIFEAELIKNKNNETAGFYYLECLNYKGRFVAETLPEKKRLFEQAIKKGSELIKIYPKSGPLRFSLITSIGLLAELNGVLKSAEDGVLSQMLMHSQSLIQNDSMYHYGAGWKVLGILNYKTPHIPLILSWPDKEKAKQLLKRSLTYFPSDLSNNFYYAEALFENDEETEAKIYFQLVLKLPARKEMLLEDEFLKEEARKYLSGMN
jgi:tetratricopeptide (TPR) repeat protein